MDQLPPYQGQSPKPNSAEVSNLDDTAVSQGTACGKTVSLLRGERSVGNQADFTPDPAARQKDQKETRISSRAVAFVVDAFEVAERKPKLDFTDVKSICFTYWLGIAKSEAHPGKKSEISSRPEECRDISDMSEDSISGLINYQRHMVEPKYFLAGDIVSYAPLLSSEFDLVRICLEDDLNLDPKDTVIIDAGSGPFCYHSALFAVAGFTVRPYDYSPARSLYDKEDRGVAEKMLSPFFKVNDKDLTGDDITPSFFDKNSVLFMSFPDLPGHPISFSLVKKYTESEALNKVVVLLIALEDKDECRIHSVLQETMDFLKENYELCGSHPTRGVLLQPSLVQIYVKR